MPLSAQLKSRVCHAPLRSSQPTKSRWASFPPVMQTDRHIPNFRRMETLHFQEHDRSHLCPARDPTSVQCALPTLKRIQAITARWKSNSPLSKTVEASLCISPHALPPSSKLEASRFESPDEPPRHTGWAPPQSRECLLSQQARSTEFVQSS